MSGIFIWAEPGDEKQKIDRESGGYVDWRNGGTASAFAVSVNTEKAFRTAWDMVGACIPDLFLPGCYCSDRIAPHNVDLPAG